VLILAVVFVVALLIGVPIAFTLGLAGMAYVGSVEGSRAFMVAARRMYTALDSFPLLAIPLFIMVGQIMEYAGLLPRLITFLNSLVGGLRGGLAHVNVLASMLFAGVSGTAVSDLAGMGRLEIEMMKEGGYGAPFSAAVTAASAMAGPIIPPSIAMVIYAIAAGGSVSIAGLFLAGVVPGLLLGSGLMAISYVVCRRRGIGKVAHRLDPREVVLGFVKTLPVLVMPVIILGGILGGVFTVTEAAAVGVVYAVLVGMLYTRELTFRRLCAAVVDAAVMSGAVAILLGAGSIVSWVLTVQRVPAQMAAWLASLSNDPVVFMLLAFAFLALLGTVMDVTAAIIMLAPIMSPVALAFGISPLQFGLVFVMTMLLGMLTPPVGILLFLTSTVSRVPIGVLSRELLPFLLWEFAVVILAILVEPITLWLPRRFGF
jgi:tripartite ATP-independent transporter DctM subunit